MDEDYTQSDISKEVERLMDQEGFEFGEAVKEAMSKGYRDGGLMIAIQKLAQGGMAGNKTYHQFHDQYVPMDEESMGYSYGGGIGSMMQPKRQGLFMGGPPLTGQALNIYNSMNAYDYTDQEIADRLSASGLYTPPGTTPPVTTPPVTTPPSGGGGGGGGGGDGPGPTIKTKKTISEKLSDPNFTFDKPTMADVTNETVSEELISAPPQKPPQSTLASEMIEAQKNLPAGLNARGTINRTPAPLASQALDDEYYDKEIIGITDRNRSRIPTETTSVLENIISKTTPGLEITDRNRGQITSTPTGGITTIDRPNMANIANDLEKGPITMKNIGVPGIEDIMSGNFAEFGPQTIGDLSNIGMAKDPDVEDPFDGKYTPSFEEKKEAEGILAGLLDKAANFDLSDLKTMGTNFSINQALKTLGFADIPSFLGTKAVTSGIDYFKNKKVQKEIKKQAAATKTRRETREIQNRVDKQETTINKNASNNDSKSGASTVNPNSKYGKDKGYTGGNPNPHTDTGWSGSSKSNKSSNKSSGTKSGGGGKGGGADMGSSSKGSVSTGAGNNPWGR